MKKWMQFVGVPFLVAGIFGMMIGPNVNVSADEPTAASGSGVTIETPAETPLGAAVITAAKKAYSLKQVTVTWTQSGEAPVSYTHLDVYKRQAFTRATTSFGSNGLMM